MIRAQLIYLVVSGLRHKDLQTPREDYVPICTDVSLTKHYKIKEKKDMADNQSKCPAESHQGFRKVKQARIKPWPSENSYRILICKIRTMKIEIKFM